MTKSEQPIFISYNVCEKGTKYLNVSCVTEAIYLGETQPAIDIRFMEKKSGCINLVSLVGHEADRAKEILDLWGILK